MAEKWCETIEIDGKQVLFTHVYDDEEEAYKMVMTIKPNDWIPGCYAAESNITIIGDEEPFAQDKFDAFANLETAEKLIKNDLLPTLQMFNTGG